MARPVIYVCISQCCREGRGRLGLLLVHCVDELYALVVLSAGLKTFRICGVLPESKAAMTVLRETRPLLRAYFVSNHLSLNPRPSIHQN